MEKEETQLSDGNMQPSMFKGFRDTCPTDVTWDEVFRLITSDHLRESTERYRYYLTHQLEADAQRIKSSAPSITPAVCCRGGRRMEQIVGYTGFGMGDFDHIPPEDMDRCRTLLNADPHVFIVYVTYSAGGIRVIYPVDSVRSYSEAFRQGNEYFAALIGHEYDPQCKNPARLSALCHDPQACYHPDAHPLHIEPKPKKEKAPKTTKTKAAARRQSSVSIDRVEPVLLEDLDKQGLCYEPGRHNEYICRAAYLLNRYGISQSSALEWALNRFADYGAAQVEQIVCSCYQHTEEHATLSLPRHGASKEGDSLVSVGEIEDFLVMQARFRHNVITKQCEICFEGDTIFSMLTDRDAYTLWRRINKAVGRTYLTDIYHVIHSEFVPLFNPFEDYFYSLPAWDGTTDYIGRLATTVHVRGDQACFEAYFRKWFVGILPALFEEGTVNNEILVFVGAQGIYKTTWFNYLLPPALRRYFYTKTNSNRLDKDDRLTLAEFALVCFEEIDGMRPTELNQLKALTTLRDINERVAYGHNKEHYSHIASFCGTGNNIQFLTDPTGNRRWLPFEVEFIDSPYEYPVPYEGVYSQALALWKGGFRYWFSNEEINSLATHNSYFEVPNLEEELISMYYCRPVPGEIGVFVTTARILERINSAIRQPLSPTKVGIVMKKMGFEPIRNCGQRGFRVVERTGDEIRTAQEAIARYTQSPSVAAD